MLVEDDSVVIMLFVFGKQNDAAVLSVDDDLEIRRIVNKILEFHPLNDGIETIFSGLELSASLDICNNTDPDFPQESRWGDLCILIDRFGETNEILYVIKDVFFEGNFWKRSDGSFKICNYDLKKCHRGGKRIVCSVERNKTEVVEERIVNLIKTSYSLIQ